MKAANAALQFVLELFMLVAFALGGAEVHLVVAIVAPLAAAALWAVWLAPRSERRLPERRRLPLKLALFALAAAAFAFAGQTMPAIIFGVVAATSTALAHILGE